MKRNSFIFVFLVIIVLFSTSPRIGAGIKMTPDNVYEDLQEARVENEKRLNKISQKMDNYELKDKN